MALRNTWMPVVRRFAAGIDIGQQDAKTVGGQAARDGLAEPSGGAGDDRDVMAGGRGHSRKLMPASASVELMRRTTFSASRMPPSSIRSR